MARAEVTGNMPMPGGGSSIVVDAPFEEGRRVMRRGVATVRVGTGGVDLWWKLPGRGLEDQRRDLGGV